MKKRTDMAASWPSRGATKRKRNEELQVRWNAQGCFFRVVEADAADEEAEGLIATQAERR